MRRSPIKVFSLALFAFAGVVGGGRAATLAQQVDAPHPTTGTDTYLAGTARQARPSTTFDTLTESKLASLEEPVSALARLILDDLGRRRGPTFDADRVKVKVVQGHRTYAEQDRLYAQGRTTPGPRVTRARAGYSYHNFKLAFDLGLYTNEGRWSYSYSSGRRQRVFVPPGGYLEDAPEYDAIGPVGTSYGLEWGGHWKKEKDRPHYQWTTTRTLEQLRQLRKDRGENSRFVHCDDAAWRRVDAAVKNTYCAR